MSRLRGFAARGFAFEGSPSVGFFPRKASSSLAALSSRAWQACSLTRASVEIPGGGLALPLGLGGAGLRRLLSGLNLAGAALGGLQLGGQHGGVLPGLLACPLAGFQGVAQA